MRRLLTIGAVAVFASAAVWTFVSIGSAGSRHGATRGSLPRAAAPVDASAAKAAAAPMAAADYAVGTSTSSTLDSVSSAIAVGDVTGDFRDDMVVVTNKAPGTGELQIYEQRVDGTYGSPRRIIPAWGYMSHVADVALGDLNGDGTLDIAFADGSSVDLLMANGLGGYTERTIDNGMYPCDDLAVAQLDTQGSGSFADVVCFSDYGGMRIHFNPANAAHYEAVSVNAGRNRGSRVQVEAVDLTGDGRPEIITGESKYADFTVWANQDGRTFVPHAYAQFGPHLGLATGDVDGDGRADVVSSYGDVYKATGRADDPLVASGMVPLQGGANALTLSDLDRNGRPDLLALYTNAGSEGRLGQMLNSYSSGFLPETFSPHPSPSTGALFAWNSLDTGDLDGDGCTDVAAAIGDRLVVSYGAGCIRPAPIAAVAHSAGRLDTDATADLTWYRDGEEYAAPWYLRGGTIAYDPGVRSSVPGAQASAAGDFDGDGNTEAVIAGPGVVVIERTLPGATTSGFSRTRPFVYPTGWLIVGAGDVDGDRMDDIVWYQPATREIYIWLIDGRGIGSGGDDSNVIRAGRGGMVAPAGLPPVAVADFNGDGRADILLGNGSELWLYQSSPVQTFSSQRISSTPYAWTLRSIGDLDGDHRADLLWYQPESGGLYAWSMAGAQVRRGVAMPSTPAGAAPTDIADFDGDGSCDVMLMSPDNIWIYRQRPEGGFESRYLAPYPKGWHLMRPYTSR